MRLAAHPGRRSAMHSQRRDRPRQHRAEVSKPLRHWSATCPQERPHPFVPPTYSSEVQQRCHVNGRRKLTSWRHGGSSHRPQQARQRRAHRQRARATECLKTHCCTIRCDAEASPRIRQLFIRLLGEGADRPSLNGVPGRTTRSGQCRSRRRSSAAKDRTMLSGNGVSSVLNRVQRCLPWCS